MGTCVELELPDTFDLVEAPVKADVPDEERPVEPVSTATENFTPIQCTSESTLEGYDIYLNFIFESPVPSTNEDDDDDAGDYSGDTQESKSDSEPTLEALTRKLTDSYNILMRALRLKFIPADTPLLTVVQLTVKKMRGIYGKAPHKISTDEQSGMTKKTLHEFYRYNTVGKSAKTIMQECIKIFKPDYDSSEETELLKEFIKLHDTYNRVTRPQHAKALNSEKPCISHKRKRERVGLKERKRAKKDD